MGVTSEALKKLWDSMPLEKRTKRLQGLRQASQDPRIRKMRAQSMGEKSKKCWQDPEYRKARSEWSRAYFTMLWTDPEYRKLHQDIPKKMWQDPKFRVEQSVLTSERMKELWQDEEYKKLKVEQGKKQWENSEDKEGWVRRLRAFRRPTKPEQILIDLIVENGLPFIYVGDGSFILEGKCPDFVNVDGKKQLIEMYGDYWHKDDNPQDRIDLFKGYGFDTLVIWEREMKDKGLVLGRIKEFERGVRCL